VHVLDGLGGEAFSLHLLNPAGDYPLVDFVDRVTPIGPDR